MSSVLVPKPGGGWKIERPEYYVQTGSMFENPYGVPHEEIVRMILDNPPEVSAQVVFGKYVESEGLVFTGEVVQQLFDRTGVHYGHAPGSFWGNQTEYRVLSQTWLWRSAMEAAAQIRRRTGSQAHFHTGVDFARQTDYTVIYTIDTRTLPAKVVYYKRLNRVPWSSIYAEIGKAAWLFGKNILCDGTGPGGDVSMDRLTSSVYCPKHHRILESGAVCTKDGQVLDCRRENQHRSEPTYISLASCDAYHFTGPSKKELVEHLRNILSVGYYAGIEEEFGWLKCPPIPQLEEELTFYTWDDKRLTTDSIFALALACWSGLEDIPRPVLAGSPFGR